MARGRTNYTVRTGTRFRAPKAASHYDVVVIGSGIGGLTCAALLSKLGKRVCVLEQHYTAGGYTHSYERDGYEWDVGVHYVGEVHKPHAALRRVFDVISDGKIEWAPMDAVYDRIVIGNDSYDLRAGRENFKRELICRFPAEAAAIEHYVELVLAASSRATQFFAGQVMPAALGQTYAAARRFWMPKYLRQTTREVLKTLTSNEQLISVLTGQWGDYGLPPGQSSFLMHAMLVKHYFAGGNYPVGGSSTIARHIIPIIEAAGGNVFTYAGVERILIDVRGAYGVRLKKDAHEIHADQIVSNAGLLPTLNRLLPTETPELARWRTRVDAGNVKPSASHVCLYVGLKGTAQSLGLPRTNYWVYPEANHDVTFARFLAGTADGEIEFPVIYISFPSAKDPAWDARYPNKATVEIVAPCLPEWFERWQGTTWGKRGDDYELFKARISTVLLDSLYRFHPNLRDALEVCELSTPLSTQWFQWNEAGEIYGLDHTVQRFDQTWLHSQTPIRNFYLTGADTVTAGVGGALMSGVMTAGCMLGRHAGDVQALLKRWTAPQAT